MTEKSGIDRIGFYIPRYYIDLSTLAEARGVSADKFYVGLGQKKMAVPPPDEDIITMAANAADRILNQEDKNNISTVIFATESGLDYSKSAGTYIHSLLGLSSHCRIFEIKQACYASTAAVQMAMSLLYRNPDQKILLLAADISRYGFKTPGESSQGSGAVAILLGANPKILAIEPESGFYSEDVMDFWRPNYCESAVVHGKYSCDLYLRILENIWQNYNQLSRRDFTEHDYFCYHVSVPSLVEKAHKRLAALNGHELSLEEAQVAVHHSLIYGREVGNCYNGSLYLSLVSLLETKDEDLTDRRIGMYSYGSGCVGEYFSGVVQPGYESVLDRDYHRQLITSRESISCEKYEQFYNFALPKDGSCFTVPKNKTGKFRLAGLENHKRIYMRTKNAN